MDRKQLKRTLESLDLSLVNAKNGTGNSIDVTLQAPDGATQKFMITRLDDPHSDKINLQQFRHFARDHQRSGTLPGIAEIDIINITPKPFTDMDVAVACVAMERDPEGIKAANRIYKNAPLVADPVRMMVAQASMPAPEPDPVPASIEKLEALVSQKPKPIRKKPMAKPTLTTVKTAVAAPEPKPERKKRTIDRRIGQVEFFRLCNILKDMDLKGIHTLLALHPKLTQAFGQDLAMSTVSDAMAATGRVLEAPKKGVTTLEAQRIVARSLVALMLKMGEPVSDDLADLADIPPVVA